MPFMNTAILAPYSSDKWRMIEDLDYLADDKTFIRIPHGFVHDLASIPVPLNLFVRVNGRHREASILHDWLYNQKGLISQFKRLNRLESDAMFLEAMKSGGVGWFKRNMMYYAVRVGGFIAWSNDDD